MKSFVTKVRFYLVLALIVVGLPMLHTEVFGHHPHDPIDALAISPAYHEDHTVFIAIGRHLKKSKNGGASWKSLVRGIEENRPVTALAVSDAFKEDGTLFMGTDNGSIYRSVDRGRSWAKSGNGLVAGGVSRIRLSPDFTKDGMALAAGGLYGLILTRNGGREWVELSITAGSVGDIAFVPGPGEASLWAGDDAGHLHVSEDGGRSWRELFHLPECGGITAIAVSPAYFEDRTVFVGTRERGVFRTTDGGISFAEKSIGLTGEHVVSLGIPSAGGVVFASTWFNGVFKSHDSGETWALHDAGLTTDEQADSPEYYSPHFRQIAISNRFDEDPTVFLAGFDGLFKSTDAGSTWKELETLHVGLIKGMDVATGANGRNAVALITYGGGAYFSEDGGNTWSINNRGLRHTRLMDVVFSPAYSSDGSVYSAAMGSLLKSVDVGVHWQRLELILDLPFQERVSRFLLGWTRRAEGALGATDAFSRRLFGNTAVGIRPYPTAIALSPSYEQDRTLFFGTRWHGIFKSTDGGTNCLPVARELGRVVHIALSPDYKNDRTLFANALGRGLYRTEDGGEHWIEINKGLPTISAPEEPDDILSIWRAIPIMISPGFAEDNLVFAGTPQGLFKSTDRGAQWQKAGLASAVADGHIAGMGISAFFNVDRSLMVSVRGRGLFRSTDGGTTFEELAPQLIEANHFFEFIAFSPDYDESQTIFGASEYSLFRSGDNGRTWEKLKRPVRYESHRDVIKYAGNWTIRGDENFSAGRAGFSSSAGDTVQLDFVGQAIRWVGTTGPDHGYASVFINDLHHLDVDLYSRETQTMVELFAASGLAHGPHTIRVEVRGKKNVESSGSWVGIDAFDVL